MLVRPLPKGGVDDFRIIVQHELRWSRRSPHRWTMTRTTLHPGRLLSTSGAMVCRVKSWMTLSSRFVRPEVSILEDALPCPPRKG
jgi:hypothetical protein